MALKIYNSVVFFDTIIIIIFSKSEIFVAKIIVREGMKINNFRQL